MNDKVMNGFIAGVLSGLIAIIVEWFLVDVIHFGTLSFSDYSGVLIYGHRPQNIPELLFANLAALIFTGAVAIAFVYLNKGEITKYFIIKAVIYSEVVWFFFNVVFILFNIPEVAAAPLNSAIVNSIADLVFGIFLGHILIWLTKREIHIT